MNPHVEQHAEILVEHSTQVERGDMVQIMAPTCAEDLVVALYHKLGKIGAQPSLYWINQRASRAYLRSLDPDSCVTSEHRLAAMEETDVHIAIQGHENTAEHSDSSSEARQAFVCANKPIRDASPDRAVVTQFPATGEAQKAEMSTEAYEKFVWDAVNQDWEAQRTFQEQLVEILDSATEVHVQSGEKTNLTLSIAGNSTINDYGERNLPGGEVYTAPVPESVEGTLFFDYPVRHAGREIEGVWLKFEDGEVVDYTAEKNEKTLGNILDTDEGARRLGELGVGMNRDINQFTHNILFDEKMGDTVHLALGRAKDESVGENQQGNDSAIHIDMLVDMSENSFIEVDEEVVQRDGTFLFEDGFES